MNSIKNNQGIIGKICFTQINKYITSDLFFLQNENLLNKLTIKLLSYIYILYKSH